MNRTLVTALATAFLLVVASCGGDDSESSDDGGSSSATTASAPSGSSGGDDCFKDQKEDDNDVRIILVNANSVPELNARVTNSAQAQEVFCTEIRTDLGEPTNVVISADDGDEIQFAIRSDTFGITFTFTCIFDAVDAATGDGAVSFAWGNTVKASCDQGFIPDLIG